MVDFYPLKIFTNHWVLTAMEQEKWDVVIALLPSTLLNTVLFFEEKTRNERLECLTFAHTILTVYRISLGQFLEATKKGKIREPCSIFQSQTARPDAPFTLWTEESYRKMSSLFRVFAFFINNPSELKMSALGTHLLEHFFGLQRCLSHGDDSYDHFMKNVVKGVMINKLKAELKVKAKISSRASDSGITLQEEKETISSTPMLWYLKIAISLLNKLHSWSLLQSSIQFESRKLKWKIANLRI
jgi:hypothetical protein